jgi:hypothetical protein
MKNHKCYECRNHNHVDCTVRLERKNAKCHCWCLDQDSHYENVFPPKELKIES